MSSPEGYEGAFWGAGLDPEGGRQARKLGPTFGASPSSPGRRGLPEPASLEEEEEREVMGAAGGPVLWGREGRPGSPAGVEGRFLDYLGSEAATAILQQLTDRDDLRVRRNPSPESCDSKVLPVWADPQPGPSGTGAPGPGVGGWRRLPSSAPARRRRARGKPRRGAKDRWQVPEERQARPAEGPVGPPSDSESSDEFSEEQLLGLSTRRRGGGQAKRHGPRDPPRHSCSHSGEKFLPVQGPFPLSAPRPLALVGDRQAAGGLDASWRKPQSAVCGKAGSRPSSLPGAAAAAAPAAAATAAAASGQPRATPGRKAAQGKKSPGGACKAAPRNTYPSWEHTASEAAALDPATFPPISGSPLGRGKRYPMAPLGTKQSRRTGTGQKGVSRRKRETMPAVVEDKEPRRDPGAEAQVSMRPCSPRFSPALPCPVLPGLPLSLSRGLSLGTLGHRAARSGRS